MISFLDGEVRHNYAMHRGHLSYRGIRLSRFLRSALNRLSTANVDGVAPALGIGAMALVDCQFV